ncbi:MAG: signal peptidase II [Anaerolineae bacterium]|nr:signal peptidase II [Anaerolineae bacterium]
MFLAAVTLLTILVDQVTKAYVVAHLPRYESWMPIDFIEPFFRFTHVRNTGASFGMFPDSGWVFSVIAVVVALVIIFYYRTLPQGILLIRLAMGLQLGGALGNNVIDRLRQGYVVDFFDVTHWPVFNVADSAIVMGVALLLLELYLQERRAARQQHDSATGLDNALPPSEEKPLAG